MINQPLVTVITVSFNSEKTIRKTIESVLNQTYKSIEYWIIDGGSFDHTLSICRGYEKAFAEKGMEFHILSEEDHGIYDAMNKGICAAQGELIGIINSDDWYEKTAIETVVRDNNEYRFDYYYADINIVKPNGDVIIKHSRKDRIVSSRHWNHPSSFVKKGVYEELGGFKCKGIHDDFDFYLRVRKSGKRIYIGDSVIANFRTGGASNDFSFEKAVSRVKDRYHCYKDNGYSSLYIIECVGIEMAKYLVNRL